MDPIISACDTSLPSRLSASSIIPQLLTNISNLRRVQDEVFVCLVLANSAAAIALIYGLDLIWKCFQSYTLADNVVCGSDGVTHADDCRLMLAS